MPKVAPLIEAPAGPPASLFQEFDRDDTRWRIAAGYEDLLDDKIDWFNLAACDQAQRVKRNAQRDVWRVRCRGRDYFAKLYHPAGAWARTKVAFRGPTALREWTVGLYAAAHCIAAVAPAAIAWRGGLKSGGPCLLISESVDDAATLSDYWLLIRDDVRAARQVTEAGARLLARAHQCGFQHGDLHPGNLLIRKVGGRHELFFVDLHNVSIGRSVSLRQIAANLAQLNQWFRRHANRSERRRFLEHYIRCRDEFAQASPWARNWQFDMRHMLPQLARQAQRHAEALWAKRDRRAMRTGKYFARLRLPGGWRGHVLLQAKHSLPTPAASALAFTAEEWRRWLARPLDWVDPARHELLKDSHTATVCRVALPAAAGPVRAVVKRSLARNFWKLIGQSLGPSRNRRSWRIANMLRNRDLPAAQPLAVVERYFGATRIDSILFTEYVSDGVDLETFLTRVVIALPHAEQRSVKNRLIDAVVRLLRAFHERGFAHRDLKAPNVLVEWPTPHEGAPRLTLVDMDGIRHVRRTSEALQMRAVARLCSSLLASPACTAGDRLRFLQRYLTAPGRTCEDWKAHWRNIHEQVCEKLNQKDVRRQWKLAHYGRE